MHILRLNCLHGEATIGAFESTARAHKSDPEAHFGEYPLPRRISASRILLGDEIRPLAGYVEGFSGGGLKPCEDSALWISCLLSTDSLNAILKTSSRPSLSIRLPEIVRQSAAQSDPLKYLFQ